MADIYDLIVQGIRNKEGLSDDALINLLNSHQESVRFLRRAYRSYPVNVPYSRRDIQNAYLLTYFPHYYQLIYKILIEDYPAIFSDKDKVDLVFVGAGPGPEIYGALKYIINNRPGITRVNITILDINATSWKHCYDILQQHILSEILLPGVEINFHVCDFDLTSPLDGKNELDVFCICDFIMFQNCLNEIAINSINQLIKNINEIFKLLPLFSSMLLIDLTGGTYEVRALMQSIENELMVNHNGIVAIHSVSQSDSCYTMQSVHHRPSAILCRHLLTGEDGLIPRKWLKYNYSFLRKTKGVEKEEKTFVNGLQAIYSPMDLSNLDANNYLSEKTFVGIDFGTSTTVVSIARIENGRIITETIPILQKDEHGFEAYRPLIQSAIALKNNRLLFGVHAYELKSELIKNETVWHSFKMELGLDNNADYEKSCLRDHDTFPINNTKGVVTLFFRYLKQQVDKYIQEHHLPVSTEICVSIPASFRECERKDLLYCLEKAEIAVGNNPFIDEPVAAVINYLFESAGSAFLEKAKNIIVIDCGAGTCDVSVLEIGINNKGAYSKNLSISRFGRLGGALIDRLIAEEVLMSQLLEVKPDIIRFNDSYKGLVVDQLREIAEKLKIALCRSFHVSPFNNFELPDLAISSTAVRICNETIILPDGSGLIFPTPKIRYREFFGIMKNYTALHFKDSFPENTIGYTLQEGLGKAKLSKSDITHVLITGGGMRNPYMQSFIAEYFSKSELIFPDNIQEHVAKGTALHSMALNSFGVNLIQPILSDDIILIDQNGRFILFKSGTEIPSADKRFEITTIAPDQTEIIIALYYAKSQTPFKCLNFKAVPNNVYQAVFYITPEKWVDCEIVEKGSDVPYTISYYDNTKRKPNYKVINK